MALYKSVWGVCGGSSVVLACLHFVSFFQAVNTFLIKGSGHMSTQWTAYGARGCAVLWRPSLWHGHCSTWTWALAKTSYVTNGHWGPYGPYVFEVLGYSLVMLLLKWCSSALEHLEPALQKKMHEQPASPFPTNHASVISQTQVWATVFQQLETSQTIIVLVSFRVLVWNPDKYGNTIMDIRYYNYTSICIFRAKVRSFLWTLLFLRILLTVSHLKTYYVFPLLSEVLEVAHICVFDGQINRYNRYNRCSLASASLSLLLAKVLCCLHSHFQRGFNIQMDIISHQQRDVGMRLLCAVPKVHRVIHSLPLLLTRSI